MSINLKNYDWTKATERLAAALGDNPLRISDNGKQALICSDEKVVAIAKVYGDDGYVSVHLRASLLPTTAGYISAILGVVIPINIDDMFEYDYDGKLLAGETAVNFASDNIKDLWFGFKEKKTGSKHNRPQFLN